MQWNKLFVFGWALVAILSSGASAAGQNSESLRQGYTRFYKAIANSELEFICGGDNYKLEKKLWAGPKLYVQDQLDWQPIAEGDSLRLFPRGIEVKGLGYRGLDYKEYIQAGAPVKIYAKQYFSNYQNSKLYWTKYYDAVEFSNTFDEFTFSVDFLNQVPSWVGLNAKSINRKLVFNESKYREDQNIDQGLKSLDGYTSELQSLRDSLKNCLQKKKAADYRLCALYKKDVERTKAELAQAREAIKEEKKSCEEKSLEQLLSTAFQKGSRDICREILSAMENQLFSYEQSVESAKSRLAECQEKIKGKKYNNSVCRSERWQIESVQKQLKKLQQENNSIQNRKRKVEESISEAPKQLNITFEPGEIKKEMSCWPVNENIQSSL